MLFLINSLAPSAYAVASGAMPNTWTAAASAVCNDQRLAPAVMMGAKNKKSSFVPYEISGGDYTPLFPLPAERDCIGMHKKHYPNGVPASKLLKEKGAEEVLRKSFPGLDLSWPGLRVLHLDPPVLIADDFFTADECDAYAALRELAGEDPTAVHELAQSGTFGGGMTSQARTSTTWFVAYQRVPTFLAKVSALLGIDNLHRFEEPQLVRYQPGQYFNWHYDAVPTNLLVNGGQRVATLLVYLNDVPQGGRTAFRDLRAGGSDETGAPLRLAVAPKKGRAILFSPAAAADGAPDDRTLHAGEPTEAGEDKWIAQLWTHERAYTPNVPEGSSQAEAEAAVRAVAEETSLRVPAAATSA
jgi:hypothetical protein